MVYGVCTNHSYAVYAYMNPLPGPHCCCVFSAQGTIGDIIQSIFDVEINYLGFLASNAAKVSRTWCTGEVYVHFTTN